MLNTHGNVKHARAEIRICGEYSHPNIRFRQKNMPKKSMNHMENPKSGYIRSKFFIRVDLLVMHGDKIIHLYQAIMVNRYQGGGGGVSCSKQS